jgi:CRISPR-associated protein Cas1
MLKGFLGGFKISENYVSKPGNLDREEGKRRVKSLYLSGYGISLSVNSGKLHVKSGKTKDATDPKETILIPKLHDCERIVIYGHSGNMSLDAIKWITKQDINLIVLNWDGRLLTNIIRPEVGQGQTRLEQYKASESDIGIGIGLKIIEAKIANTRIVLDWICSRYPSIHHEKASCFKEIVTKLEL